MFHLCFGLSDHLKALLDFVFGSRRRVKKVRIFRAWFSHIFDGLSDEIKFAVDMNAKLPYHELVVFCKVCQSFPRFEKGE